MEKAPGGSSVGVDDPYSHVDRCDFVTDEGKCRWARDHGDHDPEFADRRASDEFRCPPADPEGEWAWCDCPHFRCRTHDRECARCGLGERRVAHSDERPLLEEHHLSYRRGPAVDGEGDRPSHEITVYLCRWCHAKVHNSWARIDDDVNPDPEAIATREERRSREHGELAFESAGERFDQVPPADGPSEQTEDP